MVRNFGGKFIWIQFWGHAIDRTSSIEMPFTSATLTKVSNRVVAVADLREGQERARAHGKAGETELALASTTPASSTALHQVIMAGKADDIFPTNSLSAMPNKRGTLETRTEGSCLVKALFISLMASTTALISACSTRVGGSALTLAVIGSNTALCFKHLKLKSPNSSGT